MLSMYGIYTRSSVVILSDNDEGLSFIISGTLFVFGFHETILSFGEPGSMKFKLTKS